MPIPALHVPVIRNSLLSQLPERDRRRILTVLEPVSLTIKQVVYQENWPIECVYFPLDTILSHVARMQDGSLIDVGSVGPEGMVGLPAFLGSGRSHFTISTLITGRALRMRVGEFRAEIERGGALVSVLQRYAETFLIQLAQGQACNQLHTVQQRCVRWLLKMQDSIGSNEFEITQEFLCQVLGVRRATVSEAASALQRAGLIRYSRGKVTVLDRDGLEAAACECYGVIRGRDLRLEPKKHQFIK